MGKKKQSGGKAKYAIPIVLVLVLIVAGTVWFLNIPGSSVATLYIDRGDVEFTSGKSWEKAADGMELRLSDRVRTLDGEATLVFYDSVISTPSQLAPNTQNFFPFCTSFIYPSSTGSPGV